MNNTTRMALRDIAADLGAIAQAIVLIPLLLLFSLVTLPIWLVVRLAQTIRAEWRNKGARR